MIAPLKLILLVLAFLCFVIGATNLIVGENRVRIISAGLATWVASLLF